MAKKKLDLGPSDNLMKKGLSPYEQVKNREASRLGAADARTSERKSRSVFFGGKMVDKDTKSDYTPERRQYLRNEIHGIVHPGRPKSSVELEPYDVDLSSEKKKKRF